MNITLNADNFHINYNVFWNMVRVVSKTTATFLAVICGLYSIHKRVSHLLVAKY